MADGGHSRRWAIGHHQFDLVRASDGERYLSRWWLLKTPLGGVALHRMDAPDPRETLHDHPFSLLSLVLRGGYTERRLNPMTMTVDETHRVRRVNLVHRWDAHSIRELSRIPTWTLAFIGRYRRQWGFLNESEGTWRWTPHDALGEP